MDKYMESLLAQKNLLLILRSLTNAIANSPHGARDDTPEKAQTCATTTKKALRQLEDLIYAYQNRIRNYMFITTEGFTEDKNGNDIENAQIIGWTSGKTTKDALNQLLREIPDLADTFEELSVLEVVNPDETNFPESNGDHVTGIIEQFYIGPEDPE